MLRCSCRVGQRTLWCVLRNDANVELQLQIRTTHFVVLRILVFRWFLFFMCEFDILPFCLQTYYFINYLRCLFLWRYVCCTAVSAGTVSARTPAINMIMNGQLHTWASAGMTPKFNICIFNEILIYIHICCLRRALYINGAHGNSCYTHWPPTCVHGNSCSAHWPPTCVHGNSCYTHWPPSCVHGNSCYTHWPPTCVHGNSCYTHTDHLPVRIETHATHTDHLPVCMGTHATLTDHLPVCMGTHATHTDHLPVCMGTHATHTDHYLCAWELMLHTLTTYLFTWELVLHTLTTTSVHGNSCYTHWPLPLCMGTRATHTDHYLCAWKLMLHSLDSVGQLLPNNFGPPK